MPRGRPARAAIADRSRTAHAALAPRAPAAADGDAHGMPPQVFHRLAKAFPEDPSNLPRDKMENVGALAPRLVAALLPGWRSARGSAAAAAAQTPLLPRRAQVGLIDKEAAIVVMEELRPTLDILQARLLLLLRRLLLRLLRLLPRAPAWREAGSAAQPTRGAPARPPPVCTAPQEVNEFLANAERILANIQQALGPFTVS
jgi:hypothetical protein